MSKTIPGLNGKLVANAGVASSYYHKNILGKFTDKNLLETFLSVKPQQYDKKMIDLFTQTRLYSNDFIDTIMRSASPFYLDRVHGEFEYEITKITELPKVVVNLADSIARPGADQTEFELVFDKQAWVAGDRISAHRYEQEVQLQVVADAEPYMNFFKYRFTAIGPTNDSYVHQQFLAPGTEYFKLDNSLGEFTTVFSSIGLIDGKLKVISEGLEQYGVEHTLSDWADATSMPKDMDGNPLDITYFTLTGEMQGKTQKLVLWEPAISTWMRMEMIRMKANKLLWGSEGIGIDNKKGPVKFHAGLYRQMLKGNVIYYDRGKFTINILRNALNDLFYQRVRPEERSALIYTNEAGMDLVSKALKEDALGQGFTFIANDYVKGKDNMNLGLTFDFSHFTTRQTGKVEFKILEQLNESVTRLEQGPNKKAAPIFMVLDISKGKGANIRDLKLKNRPNMTWGYINGTTGILGSDRVASVTRDPLCTWWMKDYAGIYLEDPTRTVIIKEYPQI